MSLQDLQTVARKLKGRCFLKGYAFVALWITIANHIYRGSMIEKKMDGGVHSC